jgi:hypothetical protein
MPTSSWRPSTRTCTTRCLWERGPQTLTAFADSPVGLATFMIDVVR